MKLSILHEMATTCGAIAMGPFKALGTRETTIRASKKPQEIFSNSKNNKNRWYFAPWMVNKEKSKK